MGHMESQGGMEHDRMDQHDQEEADTASPEEGDTIPKSE
jgi:hypothetical protein